MICVRRAKPGDAAAIGAVHVATWRNVYAGVLPDDYLAGLSPVRHAAGYEHAITDQGTLWQQVGLSPDRNVRVCLDANLLELEGGTLRLSVVESEEGPVLAEATLTRSATEPPGEAWQPLSVTLPGCAKSW